MSAVAQLRPSGVELSLLLAGWRAASPVHDYVGDDRVDMALIRSLLSGEGVEAALLRFADTQANAGLVFSECCSHLAALTQELRAHAPHAVAIDWRLVPQLAEVFYGDPRNWGEDPLTKCASATYLRMRLRELNRWRTLGHGEESLLVVVTLSPTGDLSEVISSYVLAADAICQSVPFAGTVAHVLPGCFAVLVNVGQKEAATTAIIAAVKKLQIPLFVSLRPVPDDSSLDESFPRALLTPFR